MNRFHRVVATLLLAGGVGVCAVGLPASAASTAPVAEAWYQHTPVDAQVSPLCGAGIPGPGCSGDLAGGARGSAYPEQTLHVSVGNGFVDTSTVIEVERPPVTSTGLTLELPVAPEADGTANATSARVQVCLASGQVEDGAEAAPPAEAPIADCSVASRALPTFGENDTIVFVADLGPLLAATAEGPLVVAIVPTEAALSESDEWHLAFSARDRGEASAPGIAVVVAAEPAPGPSGQPAPTSTPDPAPVTRPATGPLFPPPVAIPAPGLVEPDAPAPEVAPAAPVEAVPDGQPIERRVVFPIGLIHPGVFAVPLGLVVFGGLLGIGLARPLPLDDHTSPASSDPVAAVQPARAGSAPSVRLQGARK